MSEQQAIPFGVPGEGGGIFGGAGDNEMLTTLRGQGSRHW